VTLYSKKSISADPAMRRRSRRQNLLQDYGLEASTSVRLPARSEQHDSAHMRMRREDVQSLRLQPGALSSPVIALFSTRDPREPVSLRPSETLYVRLPADTETSDTETAETREAESEQTSEAAKSEVEVEHQDKRDDKDKRHDNDKRHDKDNLDENEQPKKAEQTKSEHKQLRRRRAHSAWTPLRLVAHHSYVVGMRVSGIVHRAIVRLEFDK